MRQLRSFIILSMLLVPLGALACAIPVTHNYYMFSVFDNRLMDDVMTARTNECWAAYSDGAVNNFDETALLNIANKKHDGQMASYVRNLAAYVRICKTRLDPWNYPSAAQLNKQKAQLASIRQTCLMNQKSRIRSQYLLLAMRCNMMMGKDNENIALWQNSGSKLFSSVYRDMMEGIYARALLKQGKRTQALEIYCALGDLQSIRLLNSNGVSLADLRTVYNKNPKSAALRWMVQQAVNAGQEAQDVNLYTGMRDPLRPEYKKQMTDFVSFAQDVARGGLTDDPVMWQTAAAWTEYLYGDPKKAISMADEAAGMNGTAASKDNLRGITFYLKAAEATPSDRYDRYVLGELQWLAAKAKGESASADDYSGWNHYARVLDRVIYQQLAPQYKRWGRRSLSAGLYALLDQIDTGFGKTNPYDVQSQRMDAYNGFSLWDSYMFEALDSMSPDQLVAYKKFVDKTHSNALEQFVLAHCMKDANFLNDLIGTKYLATNQPGKALPYLSRVSLDFLRYQRIAPYLQHRSWTTEPWIRCQRTAKTDSMPVEAFNANPKVTFCRELLDLQGRYAVANAKDRAQLGIDLATRYMQASERGDCWYLTHYGWSIGDSVRTGEADFSAIACRYLTDAAQTTVPELRLKALYALAFCAKGQWCDYQWSNAAYDFVQVTMKNTDSWRAYKAFTDYAHSYPQPLPAYVTKCDVLKEFEKAN